MKNQHTRPPAAPVGHHRSTLVRSVHRAGTASRRLGSRFNRYTLHAFNPAPLLAGRGRRRPRP